MQWHPWWPSSSIHPHLVFEVLAYFIAFRLLRKAHGASEDAVPADQQVWLLVAAVAGAAIGAKGLFWLEDPAATWAHRFDPGWLFSGRTIVGAFLGGWAGTELAKRVMGVSRSTGDIFVLPMGVGLMIGRVGCFLSGVDDGTHGIPTGSFLGMDLGDGIPRHPATLYEILWLAVLTPVVNQWSAPVLGDQFLAFMAGYLAFRLGVEFLKIQPPLIGGLSAIQLACLLGLVCTSWMAWSRRQ